eukprot:g2749.t1
MVVISSKMLLSLVFAPIFFGIHDQVTAVKMNCCNGEETAGEQKTEVEGVDPTRKEDTPFGPPAAASAEVAPAAAEPVPVVGGGGEEAGQASGSAGAGEEQNADTSGAAAGTKKASKPCCSMM